MGFVLFCFSNKIYTLFLEEKLVQYLHTGCSHPRVNFLCSALKYGTTFEEQKKKNHWIILKEAADTEKLRTKLGIMSKALFASSIQSGGANSCCGFDNYRLQKVGRGN